MTKIDSLDPTTPMGKQLAEEAGPVMVMNTFFVPRASAEEFLTRWAADAKLMTSAPGFVSTQMHRGLAGSQLFVNVAVWESTGALAAAHSNPEFRRSSSELPDGVVAYPHIFEKIAVDGICEA